MRIKETCACGAQIEVGSGAVSALSSQTVELARCAEQVEKWRALHVGCLTPTTQRVQPLPLSEDEVQRLIAEDEGATP